MNNSFMMIFIFFNNQVKISWRSSWWFCNSFKSSYIKVFKSNKNNSNVIHRLFGNRSFQNSINSSSTLFMNMRSSIFKNSFPHTLNDFSRGTFVKNSIASKKYIIHLFLNFEFSNFWFSDNDSIITSVFLKFSLNVSKWSWNWQSSRIDPVRA